MNRGCTNLQWVFLNVISLIVFIFLAWSVVWGKSNFFDLTTLNFLSFLRSETITNIMFSISSVFHPAILLLASLLLFLFLLFRKRKTIALFFFSTMLVSVSSGLIFKAIFDIARPLNSIALAFGPGFPSNHAVASAVFFLTLLYVLEHKITDRALSFLFAFVSISMILLSGISRLYLGVHWLSDVLAGLALGLFWTTLGILILKRYEIPPKKVL